MGFKKIFNRLSKMSGRLGFASSTYLSKNQSEQIRQNENCDKYDNF